MATKIVNARDCRNNIGMNGVPTDATGAQLLNYQQFRRVRNDLVKLGSNGQSMTDLATAMQNSGMFDPNVLYNAIVDGYYQDLTSFNWTAQQNALKTALTRKNTNGSVILNILENVNEVGWTTKQGGGYVTPNGTVQQGIDEPYTTGSPIPDSVRAMYVQWNQAVYNFKQANASLFTQTKLIAPSMLDFSGRFGNGYGDINVAQYNDFGNIHWYMTANGGNSTPSGNNDGNLFPQTYNGFKAGTMGGSKELCLTECGVNTSSGTAQDGVSCAWMSIAQILDFYAIGGKLIFFYTATNDAGFQWYNSNTTFSSATAQPRAKAFRNFQTLMSLGNNYSSTANLTDTAAFSPGYTGGNLSITGLDSAGTVASSLITAKSDGSAILWIWREPKYDNGSGAAQSQIPTVNPITVNFGQSVTWKQWDVFGGTGGNTRTVTDSPTQVGSTTTSTSASINLYTVVAIEISAINVTTAPSTPATPTLGATTATSQVINFTQTATGTANAVQTVTPQLSTNNGTSWTTAATLTAMPMSTYKYIGLTSSTPYLARYGVANTAGGPVYSGSVGFTTSAPVVNPTTPTLVQAKAFRVDTPNGQPQMNLSLDQQPNAANMFLLTWSGYAGSGSNSNAISVPTGSTQLFNPYYTSEEVIVAWLVPYTANNTWTVSNYDYQNDGVFNLFELAAVSTYDTAVGAMTTNTTTQVSWPLGSPTSSNCVRISLLSLTYAATIGSPTAGLNVLLSDSPSVTYHQSVVLTENGTVTGPVTLNIQNGNSAAASAYANFAFYGAGLPPQVQGVGATNVTNTGATLSWTGVGTAAESYTVRVSSDNTTFTDLATVSASITSYSLTLSPGSTSYYGVAANNASGRGPMSASVKVIATTTGSAGSGSVGQIRLRNGGFILLDPNGYIRF